MEWNGWFNSPLQNWTKTFKITQPRKQTADWISATLFGSVLFPRGAHKLERSALILPTVHLFFLLGKFIISAGRYTDIADDGPGFRFICSNCSRNSGGVPETHNSGIFLLELSTTTKKWRIHLDTIPRWWFHFAFTWSPNQGLKYYKNGKFVLGKKNPERFMVATDTNITKIITIGRPNLLKAMSRKNSRGKFSLGHLVIWTHEASKYDMEIAFLSVLTAEIKSVVCCQQLRGDDNNN